MKEAVDAAYITLSITTASAGFHNESWKHAQDRSARRTGASRLLQAGRWRRLRAEERSVWLTLRASTVGSHRSRFARAAPMRHAIKGHVA